MFANRLGDARVVIRVDLRQHPRKAEFLIRPGANDAAHLRGPARGFFNQVPRIAAHVGDGLGKV